MPKKFGENSKAAAGRERKAAQEAEKKSKKQAELERKEEEKWNQGAKKGGKKESEAEKRAARLAKKAELDALKQQEEKELSKIKQVSAAKNARLEEKRNERNLRKAEDLGKDLGKEIPVFSASNLDDALEALEIADEKTARPGGSGAPDRHVERRLKAAYAAYEERELPILKRENPSLRLTQLKQMLWKQWQKSPENPLNQQSLAYNATREQETELIKQRRENIEARLKE
ncbi:hypothetical protein BDF22DRAFT_670559 [Syncephalis plumigaleata]|nr:hypothetical protein BDF22DRAFT_670559 [Syncephalis plumigaleata]